MDLAIIQTISFLLHIMTDDQIATVLDTCGHHAKQQGHFKRGIKSMHSRSRKSAIREQIYEDSERKTLFS
jgi:hypothetical protein